MKKKLIIIFMSVMLLMQGRPIFAETHPYISGRYEKGIVVDALMSIAVSDEMQSGDNELPVMGEESASFVYQADDGELFYYSGTEAIKTVVDGENRYTVDVNYVCFVNGDQKTLISKYTDNNTPYVAFDGYDSETRTVYFKIVDNGTDTQISIPIIYDEINEKVRSIDSIFVGTKKYRRTYLLPNVSVAFSSGSIFISASGDNASDWIEKVKNKISSDEKVLTITNNDYSVVFKGGEGYSYNSQNRTIQIPADRVLDYVNGKYTFAFEVEDYPSISYEATASGFGSAVQKFGAFSDTLTIEGISAPQYGGSTAIGNYTVKDSENNDITSKVTLTWKKVDGSDAGSAFDAGDYVLYATYNHANNGTISSASTIKCGNYDFTVVDYDNSYSQADIEGAYTSAKTQVYDNFGLKFSVTTIPGTTGSENIPITPVIVTENEKKTAIITPVDVNDVDYKNKTTVIEQSDINTFISNNNVKAVNIVTGLSASQEVGGDKAPQARIVDYEGNTIFEAEALGGQLRYDKKVSGSAIVGCYPDDTNDKSAAINYVDLRLQFEITLPAGVLPSADTTSWNWTLTYYNGAKTVTKTVNGVNYLPVSGEANTYTSNVVVTNIPAKANEDTKFKATLNITYVLDDVTYIISQSSEVPLARTINGLVNYYKTTGYETLSDNGKIYINGLYTYLNPSNVD